MKTRNYQHQIHHVTPKGVSVFNELFEPGAAAALKLRAELLLALQTWLDNQEMTQHQASKILEIPQARISELKRGKFNAFSLRRLVRLAARAGLRPEVKLAV